MLLSEGLRIGRFIHAGHADPLQGHLLAGPQAVPGEEELVRLQVVEFLLKRRFEFLGGGSVR